MQYLHMVNHKHEDLPPQWNLAVEDYVFHLLREAGSPSNPSVLDCPLHKLHQKTRHLQSRNTEWIHCNGNLVNLVEYYNKVRFYYSTT